MIPRDFAIYLVTGESVRRSSVVVNILNSLYSSFVKLTILRSVEGLPAIKKNVGIEPRVLFIGKVLVLSDAFANKPTKS